MDKRIIYIFAVGLVLMFVIEMFAMGFLGSNSARESTTQNQVGSAINGSALVNITIARYETYIIVSGGNSTEVERIAARLKEAGIVDYTTKNPDGLIVSLKESKFAPEAADAFADANATALATVVISLPATLKIEGDGISTTAEGTSFNTQMRPIYTEGSKQEATFFAEVQNGKVTGLWNFAILPRTISGAIANVTVISQPSAAYTLEIPWESRNTAKAIALAGNATYKEKSYIIVPTDLAQDSLTAVSKAEFVTGVSPGTVSVKNEFEDRWAAESQLAALKITSTFPSSLASFPNQTGNASAILLMDALAGKGINASLTMQSRAKLKLPEIIEVEGEKYKTGGLEFMVDGQLLPANASEARFSLDFTAEGGRIVKMLAARPA
ncbi:MAG: hypothetical protein NT051_01290 [Candidatus Micrarchaeota archaeon]|nr:hypothetical protein [Candidatus Micrarchaeota archaeon]